ncbi:MAG: glycerate kinase [Kiritimatiellae bacterium]|nr:glycerate kinase [Kiritimatiellia bacterium]
MNVLIAIDSFKGSLGSVEAGMAAAEGVRRVFPDAACAVRPLADGGEGTVDALVAGLGGEMRRATVTGPAGRPVAAAYGVLPGGTAVMEMASAAGITLVSGAEKNPLRTTTFGVGEMIADALAAGCRRFVVGIGGSATNDAGAGMLQALGFRLLDAEGRDVPRGGAGLARVERVEAPAAFPDGTPLAACTFRVACDVANPLCGANGASAVFGPQKGATPAMAAELDAALARFASVAGDAADRPGDGAAGGLGFAFRRFLGAELVRGVELVASETKLEDFVRAADVVVTGEGRLDGQTAMGKAPIGVARLAKKHGKRVLAFSGCVGDGVETLNAAGVDAYFPILRKISTLEEALDKANAAENLAATVEQVFRVLGK